jgi:hypothetical protein
LHVLLKLLGDFQPIILRTHGACLLETDCRYGLFTIDSSSTVKTGKIVWSKHFMALTKIGQAPLKNPAMHLTAIAWIYVVLMMSAVELASPQGTVLGALSTFVFYGLLPLGVILYIMGTPARRRLRQAQQDRETAAAEAADRSVEVSDQPDAGRHATAGHPIPPDTGAVREKG